MLEKEIEQLTTWSKSYYDGTPSVTDDVFDKLYDKVITELREKDPANPFLAKVGAPVDGWAKHEHKEVMGSLAKVNNEQDFLKWAQDKGSDFIILEKLDGWSVIAEYEKGELKTFSTRGDGKIGDLITSNAPYVTGVPQRIEGFTGTLRGEATILFDDFKKHFVPLNIQNSRNAVAKLRDSGNHSLKKYIQVKYFDIMGPKFDKWTDKIKFINSLGLQTVKSIGNLTSEQVWKAFKVYEETKRKSLEYGIDGLVCRVNSIKQHDELGSTDNRPKGSIAIKFQSVGVETQLLSVEFHRGSSGRIAPVGIVKPVLVDGSTVTRTSLHGQDWINQMNLKIGDTVLIAKAGDIIPQIQQVISSSATSRIIIFPTNCPECLAKLVKNGAYLECRNANCIGELVGAITKWVEKNDIKGIGDSMIQILSRNIKDISDLYTSGPKLFIDAAKGSKKIGDKVYKAVQQTKKIKLKTLLAGLNIDSLGDTNSEKLADTFNSLEDILKAKEEQFKMPGISENSQKIFTGLQQKKDLIKKLASILTIENKSLNTSSSSSGKLNGITVCITGTLSKPRKDIENWIIKNGGSFADTITKNVKYLVTNDPNSGSSKNAKADKLGIKKITEEELYNL